MPTSRNYHVELDGNGFVLLDESYTVQAQRPFSPRFATGDPSFGDLSFWQFLTQENFDGGEGQEDFEETNKYLQSTGWDIRDGKPRLSFGDETLTPTNSAPNNTGPNGHAAKVVHFGNDVYICYLTADPAFTRTQIQAQDIPNNKPNIYHVNCADMVPMKRDSTVNAAGLACVNGGLVNIYSEAFALLGSSAISSNGQAIVQVDHNVLLIGGTTAAGSGIPRIARLTLIGSGWTKSAGTDRVVTLDGGTAQDMVNSAAIDSDGTVYFATQDHTEVNLRTPSRIIRFTAADATGTALEISDIDYLPGFTVRSIFEVNGTVFLAGALLENENDIRRAIFRFPDIEVWRSTKVYSDFASASERSYFTTFSNLQGTLVFTENDDDGYTPIQQVRSDSTIREVVAFNFSPLSSGVSMLAFFEYNGRFYAVRSDTAGFSRSKSTRGGFSTAPAEDDLILTLSKFGANTQLINKSLYKVTVELSEAIPAGQTLTVEVNGTTVGTVVNADGTRKEITLTSELTGSSFQPKLRIDRTATWAGHLERITLQYIPTQFKKLGWGFTFRADSNLRLLGGQREQKDGQAILAQLKTSWQKNTPISFTDVDGTAYTVIITDFRARQPIQHQVQGKREYLVSIELLEV